MKVGFKIFIILKFLFVLANQELKLTSVPRLEAENTNEDPFEMRASAPWGMPQKATKNKSICFFRPNEGII